MSRRTATIVGHVAWLLSLLLAPEKSLRGLVIWGAVTAVVIVVAVVGSRMLARAMKRTFGEDEP